MKGLYPQVFVVPLYSVENTANLSINVTGLGGTVIFMFQMWNLSVAQWPFN